MHCKNSKNKLIKLFKFTLISESNLTKYFQFDGRRLASIIFRHALEYWGKKLNNLENNFPRFCLF